MVNVAVAATYILFVVAAPLYEIVSSFVPGVALSNPETSNPEVNVSFFPLSHTAVTEYISSVSFRR